MTELEGGLHTEMNGMRRFEIRCLDLEIFFVKKLWEIITLKIKIRVWKKFFKFFLHTDFIVLLWKEEIVQFSVACFISHRVELTDIFNY